MPTAPVQNEPTIAPIIIDVSSTGSGLSPEAAQAARELSLNLERAIAKDPRLEFLDDVALIAALYGNSTAIAISVGTKAAEAATVAAESNRCADATRSAESAVVSLAAAQTISTGKQLEASESGLRLAYRARFLCSLKDSDPTVTLHWAKRLRSVGQQGPPKGVSDDVWANSPELDASTNINLARLTVKSKTNGATVFVDHKKRGVTPLTIHVPQGHHVVAVGFGNASLAQQILISGWTHTEVLDEQATKSRWGAVAALVTSLQDKTRAADAEAIAEVMTLAGAQAAFVIVGGGTIELWRKDAQGKATRIGQRRDAKQVVSLLSQSLGARSSDPTPELLRNDPKSGSGKDTEPSTKWWVYAAVLGAAAVGAGIIIAGQSGTDRQRIEISLP